MDIYDKAARNFYIGSIILGLLIAISGTFFTNMPLSSTITIAFGILFSIGAFVDYRDWKKQRSEIK